MKLTKLLVASAALIGSISTANAITFYLGGNGGDGYDGNKISFSQDGLTVTASAWNSSESRTDWNDRKLGQWGTWGLGVGGDESHTVDNQYGIDYVLFEFSEIVNPISLYLKSVDVYRSALDGDTDIQFWVGNASTDNNPATTDFTEVDFNQLVYGGGNYGGQYSRLATLNTELTGNALLIGANVEPGNAEDSFKIKKLTVEIANVPDTGSTLALFGIALVTLGAIAKRRKD